jgi:hypothetical protein
MYFLRPSGNLLLDTIIYYQKAATGRSARPGRRAVELRRKFKKHADLPWSGYIGSQDFWIVFDPPRLTPRIFTNPDRGSPDSGKLPFPIGGTT